MIPLSLDNDQYQERPGYIHFRDDFVLDVDRNMNFTVTQPSLFRALVIGRDILPDPFTIKPISILTLFIDFANIFQSFCMMQRPVLVCPPWETPSPSPPLWMLVLTSSSSPLTCSGSAPVWRSSSPLRQPQEPLPSTLLALLEGIFLYYIEPFKPSCTAQLVFFP